MDWSTPPIYTPPMTLREFKSAQEEAFAAFIADTLRAHDGRQRQAAEALDITPGALWQLIQRRPALVALIEEYGHGPGAPKKIDAA